MADTRPQFELDVGEAFNTVESAEFYLHELARNAVAQLRSDPRGIIEFEDACSLIQSMLDCREARVCITRAIEFAEERSALTGAGMLDDIIAHLETARTALARDPLAAVKRIWAGHDEAVRRLGIAREQLDLALTSILAARGGTA
jgi:hypothetical protein